MDIQKKRAFGIGHTELEARMDAMRYGHDKDEGIAKEITLSSFRQIKGGNTEAIEIVDEMLKSHVKSLDMYISQHNRKGTTNPLPDAKNLSREEVYAIKDCLDDELGVENLSENKSAFLKKCLKELRSLKIAAI